MNGHTRLAALLALAALALPASAKTYYVDAANGDDANTGLKADLAFATIQKAIDKAADGSTILVAPGTYAPVRMNKKLTIKATDGAETTVIDGSLGEKYVPAPIEVPDGVEYDSDWNEYYYYDDAGNYHQWLPPDDETIWVSPAPKAKTWKQTMKSGSYTYTYLYEDRVGEVRCTDACVVMGKLSHLRRTNKSEPKNFYGTNFVSVAASVSGFTVKNAGKGIWGGSASHCTVTGIDGMPVAVCSLSDSLIENNNAIQLFSTSGSLASAATLNRCVITGNRIEASYQCCGISTQLHPGSIGSYCNQGAVYNTLVVGNDVWWPGFGFDFPVLCAAPAYNSTFADNSLDGAVAVSGDLYNCIVWGNRGEGGVLANFRKTSDATTGEERLTAYEPCSYEAIGTFYDSKTGEEVEIPYVYTAAPGRAMVNCCVEDKAVATTGSLKTQDFDGKKQTVVTKTVTFPASKNNLAKDPLFIDAANGDYRLALDSPCANAGADYTKKTGKFDLDSGARKVGKVDMGAYELQPQTAVPADYDGDGKTDPAFYFASSGQWWIFQSRDGLRTISLPDRNGVPCPADYDGDAKAEPAYFTAAAKTPEFVRAKADGSVERTAFGAKGAKPVAAKLPGKTTATFGVYTANAKKPAFSFLGDPLSVTFGAKGAKPVAADFTGDGKDDLGVYTASASKPAFSALQSDKAYSTALPFEIPSNPFYPTARKSVPLGTKGSVPCCADYDGDGKADFATYSATAAAPAFTRLLSSTKYSETRTLPMGRKGDVAVCGVYEAANGPANPAVWTGSKWTYIDSSYADVDLLGE